MSSGFSAPIVLVFSLLSPHIHAQIGGLGLGAGGGSILNRGGDRPGQRGGSPIGFSYYGALLGNYTSGFIPVAISETGTVSSLSSYGGSVEGGITGSRSFGRSVLGVDLRADYRRYTKGGFLGNANGSDAALSVFYSNQPSRRWTYQLNLTGLTSNRAVGGFVAPTFVRQDLTGVPLNDILDNRVYALQMSAAAAYRLSARNQVTFFGMGYGARRASSALVGTNGYGGGIQFARAFTARTTAGVMYNYMKFRFPRAFGSSDVQSVAFTLERRIGRDWFLSGNFGAFRAETLGTNSVALDPAIAEILGTQTGIQAIYRVDYGPWYTGAINYRLSERAACMIGFTGGVTPGNGLYLSSRLESQNAGCSLQLPKRAALSGNAGRTSMSSIYQDDLGRFTSYQAGGGLNMIIFNKLNFISQLDYRTFTIRSGGSQGGWVATMGLGINNTGLPIPRW